jgi:hypothetical protein
MISVDDTSDPTLASAVSRPLKTWIWILLRCGLFATMLVASYKSLTSASPQTFAVIILWLVPLVRRAFSAPVEDEQDELEASGDSISHDIFNEQSLVVLLTSQTLMLLLQQPTSTGDSNSYWLIPVTFLLILNAWHDAETTNDEAALNSPLGRLNQDGSRTRRNQQGQYVTVKTIVTRTRADGTTIEADSELIAPFYILIAVAMALTAILELVLAAQSDWNHLAPTIVAGISSIASMVNCYRSKLSPEERSWYLQSWCY